MMEASQKLLSPINLKYGSLAIFYNDGSLSMFWDPIYNHGSLLYFEALLICIVVSWKHFYRLINVEIQQCKCGIGDFKIPTKRAIYSKTDVNIQD